MQAYETSRQRLFVNADDFGVSPRANRNILYLVSLGKIDRVGVMSLGQISAKEIDELSKSGVKIDIHLDILHKLDEQRSERSSAILRGFEFVGKIFTGKISPKKVEADWEKQIQKFQKLFGKNPDGINSHEHVHFFPPFFKVATKLAEKYSVPYLRFGDATTNHTSKPVAIILHVMRILDRRIFQNSTCVSSNSLISLDWIGDIEKFLQNLPEGSIEIACHPELADDFVKIKKYF